LKGSIEIQDHASQRALHKIDEISFNCTTPVWYHHTLMPGNNKKKKNPDTPDLAWGLLIAVWTALIYIIFTMNFVGNFISHRGG